MCSKWLFHFLAEKRLWIPNRFSARLFHDFDKRGRDNRESRRPRIDGHRPRSAHTHVKRRASHQADFRSGGRAPRTRAQFKVCAPHPRTITMQDLTTPEHEIEDRNSQHTKLKPATPHNETEARNSQHTKLKSATPDNEIEVRNSQHTKLKPATPDNDIEARSSQHMKL